jgi:hypothetical protein
LLKTAGARRSPAPAASRASNHSAASRPNYSPHQLIHQKTGPLVTGLLSVMSSCRVEVWSTTSIEELA